MAIDLWCSECSSLGISPRISFSHDLNQTDVIPIDHSHNHHRSDSLLLESNSDFDFCVSQSFEQESSCADELFSDGKILPLQIKKPNLPPKPPPPPPPQPPTLQFAENSKKESLKEIMEKSSKLEEKSSSSSSKSFWRFKRSSSCGNGSKRSLICSLPLLSRSNSTGSAPIPKRNHQLSSKDHNYLKHSQKFPSSISTSKPSSSYSYSSSYTSMSQKPPLKKNYGSYGNGVRISPVLNVPPPYISKGTANLFGLGSFFCNGKEKNKKK